MFLRRLSIFFYFLLSFFVILSCIPAPQTPQPSLQPSLYVYRFNPPALVEFSEDFQLVSEIPFSIPPNCELFNIFSPPVGKFIAIELNCPNGQTVLYMDVESASVIQPVTNTDSHFLAWALDGTAAYLKIDSLGNTRVISASTDGKQDSTSISEFTYDLAPSRKQGEFTFTFSH